MSLELSRETVQKLCPACHDRMAGLGLRLLKIHDETPPEILTNLGLQDPALRAQLERVAGGLIVKRRDGQERRGVTAALDLVESLGVRSAGPILKAAATTGPEPAAGSIDAALAWLGRVAKQPRDPNAVCGALWFNGTEAQREAFGGGTEGRGREEKPPKDWFDECLDKISKRLAVVPVAKVIRERDGKFCVMTADESKVLGCHDTREEAEAQLRAVEANKNKRGLTYRVVKGTDGQERRQVFGYANVAMEDGRLVLDLQGEAIAPEALVDAAHLFAKEYGESGVNHEGAAVGRVIESVVFTPEKTAAILGPVLTDEVVKRLEAAQGREALLGVLKDAVGVRWWYGAEVQPAVFERVKSGELQAFSIQGAGLGEPLYA